MKIYEELRHWRNWTSPSPTETESRIWGQDLFTHFRVSCQRSGNTYSTENPGQMTLTIFHLLPIDQSHHQRRNQLSTTQICFQLWWYWFPPSGPFLDISEWLILGLMSRWLSGRRVTDCRSYWLAKSKSCNKLLLLYKIITKSKCISKMNTKRQQAFVLIRLIARGIETY